MAGPASVQATNSAATLDRQSSDLSGGETVSHARLHMHLPSSTTSAGSIPSLSLFFNEVQSIH